MRQSLNNCLYIQVLFHTRTHFLRITLWYINAGFYQVIKEKIGSVITFQHVLWAEKIGFCYHEKIHLVGTIVRQKCNLIHTLSTVAAQVKGNNNHVHGTEILRAVAVGIGNNEGETFFDHKIDPCNSTEILVV